MNIADRSLALVDLALRRRFAFEEFNKSIAEAPSLGPQFRIGHSYVTPDQKEHVLDGRIWFRSKVETEIGPLLDEYWYDAPEIAKKARADLVVGL